MALVRAHVFVSGRVQGVFFRGATEDRARALGLTGWVRNLHDGRVEAWFEGERDDVEAAVAFARKGPRGAHVLSLSVDWGDPSGAYDGFEVR